MASDMVWLWFASMLSRGGTRAPNGGAPAPPPGMGPSSPQVAPVSPVRRAAARAPGTTFHTQPAAPAPVAPVWPEAPPASPPHVVPLQPESPPPGARKGVVAYKMTDAGTWTPDVPLSPGVPERARQLLPKLWQGGKPGASVQEDTNGAQILYKAVWMQPTERTLKLEHPYMTGADVKAVQAKLNIPASGNYDEATANAVKAYQHLHGLTVDGEVGKQTRGAMGL